jgi:hypothetical protein
MLSGKKSSFSLTAVKEEPPSGISPTSPEVSPSAKRFPELSYAQYQSV